MSELRKSHAVGHTPKPAGLRRTRTAGDSLTCTESEVEDLLSQGESTATECKTPLSSTTRAGRKLPRRA